MRNSIFCVIACLGAACGDSTGPSGGAGAAALAIGPTHSCQITAAGTRCWGRGAEGQLGIGTTPADAPPTALTSGAAFTSLAAGTTHTCALDADGTAWCWGSNGYGELGTGDQAGAVCGAATCRASPVAVNTAIRFRSLAASRNFTCGIATDGGAYCWGLNDQGQLGSREDTTCGGIRCSPTPIRAAAGVSFTSITTGYAHVCGIDLGGRAVCWGYNGLPVAGQHNNAAFLPDTQSFGGALRFASLSAGGYHTCGIGRDDVAYCWGIDAVGAGPAILEADHPVPVNGAHHFTAIRAARFSACGLDTQGRVLCWGADVASELASGDPTFHGRYDEPTQITGTLRFASIVGGGSNYCGTSTDGSLYCWGRGTEGQLGQGHSDAASPEIVPGS